MCAFSSVLPLPNQSLGLSPRTIVTGCKSLPAPSLAPRIVHLHSHCHEYISCSRLYVYATHSSIGSRQGGKCCFVCVVICVHPRLFGSSQQQAERWQRGSAARLTAVPSQPASCCCCPHCCGDATETAPPLPPAHFARRFSPSLPRHHQQGMLKTAQTQMV